MNLKYNILSIQYLPESIKISMKAVKENILDDVTAITIKEILIHREKFDQNIIDNLLISISNNSTFEDKQV